MNSLKRTVTGLGLILFAEFAAASDLNIHLNGADSITRHTVMFQCDSEAAKLGLPEGVFAVEYLNGGGNSLAVLPIGGKSIIFANVIAASGARYASGSYIWWDAGARGITLYSDSLSGKNQSSCKPVAAK